MLAMFAEDGIGVTDGFVQRHLEICDFCRAEVEFYRAFPPVDEVSPEPGPVPEALYQLAMALLDRPASLVAFYRLVSG
jgi:hypothetical protein